MWIVQAQTPSRKVVWDGGEPVSPYVNAEISPDIGVGSTFQFVQIQKINLKPSKYQIPYLIGFKFVTLPSGVVNTSPRMLSIDLNSCYVFDGTLAITLPTVVDLYISDFDVYQDVNWISSSSGELYHNSNPTPYLPSKLPDLGVTTNSRLKLRTTVDILQPFFGIQPTVTIKKGYSVETPPDTIEFTNSITFLKKNYILREDLESNTFSRDGDNFLVVI